MGKRLLILASVLVGVGGSVWGVLVWYTQLTLTLPAPSDAEIGRLLSRRYGHLPTQPPLLPMAPLDRSHPVRLAIGGFGLTDDARNRELADLVAVQLSNVKGFALIDRSSLEKALRELGLRLSGVVRASDAIRVGKLLKADWFLVGSEVRSSSNRLSIVTRIVDVQTGIMRDVGAFDAGLGSLKLAGNLAAFARRCREAGAKSKPCGYLAIGSFGDVGVNQRQSGFPRELRAYLTRAYQGSSLTLLERDHVSALLQEVRLDLAGLTDDATHAPPPLQSAFWMVDGYFQSFETSNHQVEVVIEVSRAFGRTREYTIRGEPEEAMRRIKSTIDETIARAPLQILAPTRRSEVRQELATGEVLFKEATGDLDPILMVPPGLSLMRKRPAQEPAMRRRNLEQAIRAFQTALLLEHDNHEAKFYLGTCYRDPSVYNIERARGYLREVAASSPEDQWTETARVAMARSYDWDAEYRKAEEWFHEAAQKCKDPRQAEFYRAQALEDEGKAIAAEGAASGNGPAAPEDRTVFKQRVFSSVQTELNAAKGLGGGLDDSCGLQGFVQGFGVNHAAAAKALLEFLPALKARFPEFTPHLLAASLTYQTDANTPLLPEFRASIQDCGQHPEKVVNPSWYFEILLRGPYYWAMDHGAYSLALEVAEARSRAAIHDREIVFDDHDKVKLAYAYIKLERWADALRIFEAMGDRPIQMIEDGPWGQLGLVPFLPAQAAAQCRQRLGLTQPHNSRYFELSKPLLPLEAFACGDDGLWVGVSGKLVRLDFDLNTNRQIELPPDTHIPPAGICIGDKKMWLATRGSGLLEVEKASGICRRITERDGLLLNEMTSLCSDEHFLWLGFAKGTVGGLGRMEIANGRLSSFTPGLAPDPNQAAIHDPSTGPPRHPVDYVTCVNGQVWMLIAGGAPRYYDPSLDTWQGLPELDGCRFDSFGADARHLVVAFGRTQLTVVLRDEALSNSNPQPRTTAVRVSADELHRLEADPKTLERIREIRPILLQTIGVKNWLNGKWRMIPVDDALPARPTSLALNGTDAFLGGQGYLAVFDLNRAQVRRLCYFPAVDFDRFDFGGGFFWVQVRGYLYRVPLSELN